MPAGDTVSWPRQCAARRRGRGPCPTSAAATARTASPPAATDHAADLTRSAVTSAVDTLGKPTAEAKRAFTASEQRRRTELAAAAEATRKLITDELQRTLGGDNPALPERLQPVLDTFGVRVDELLHKRTDELIRQAARQFDPADSTSPMATPTTTLAAQQQKASAQLEKDHGEITAAVAELSAVVRVGREQSNVVRLTTLKGATLEGEVHRLLQEVAAGLGDEYVDATNAVGLLSRCKKGDGVLHVGGGATGVVL